MNRQLAAFALLAWAVGAAMVLTVHGLLASPSSPGHAAAFVGLVLAGSIVAVYGIGFAATAGGYAGLDYARRRGWTRATRHYVRMLREAQAATAEAQEKAAGYAARHHATDAQTRPQPAEPSPTASPRAPDPVTQVFPWTLTDVGSRESQYAPNTTQAA